MLKLGQREELGCIGHFIAAHHCLWRRHTQVRHYRISTVGHLIDPHNISGNKRELAAVRDSFYETMVFALTDKPVPHSEGCGCRQKPARAWELDVAHCATAGEAQAQHEAMVAKYINKRKRNER